MTFTTRHTTTWTDRSALQVRLMALSVPSDRNRRPRAGVRGADRRAGAALGWRRWRPPGGRTGSFRAFETGRSDRRAPIRADHGHIIYIPRVAAGAGETMAGGALDRHAGVSSAFRAPKAKIGYPSMSLTIGCGHHISGPHRIWVEVRPQGVPQTGKIIEVKRRLSGSFFSIPEGLAVLFWVAWLDRMSQERW